MRIAIADTIEKVTPDWLTVVLRDGGVIAGESVSAVSARALGTGQMCDSYRLTIEYSEPTQAPRSLIVKLPSLDVNSRAAAKLVRAYEKEVRFYQQLAHRVHVSTPRVYWADIADDLITFVLVMADLAPAMQGDQMNGCTIGEAGDAMDQLVALHAPLWDSPELLDLTWLVGNPDEYRATMTQLFPMFWDGFRDRYADRLEAIVHEAGGALFGNVPQYLAVDPAPHTVVHGDFRLDNLLFTPGDKRRLTGVVDWQTVGHGPAMRDVAYFIGAGLHAADRRHAEQALVRRYHAGLVENGVTDYAWADCWEDYRKGTWSGLVMAVAASMLVERTDRGDEMFMTMAHRHAQHALDLKAPIS